MVAVDLFLMLLDAKTWQEITIAKITVATQTCRRVFVALEIEPNYTYGVKIERRRNQIKLHLSSIY